MGGGAAMRAAGKVAGMGVFNGGFMSSATPAAQSLRNVSRPVAATISSGKVSVGDVTEAQKATWEMVDDWEFAGGVDDSLVEPAEPMPRVVFGAAPSLEETKEATAELKDALDKVYLSSSNSSISEHGDPFIVGGVSSLPLLANSEYTETKSCITCDLKSASVPKPAIQAFKLLSESPAAQSIVASIACDPDVWNAVLKNEALVDFIQSQKINDMHQYQVSREIFEEVYDSSKCGDTESQPGETGSSPTDFFQTIKNTVLDMVNNIAGYLQNIFGFAAAAAAEDKTSADADARAFPIDKTVGAAFSGLAMMVIMVVLLKRA